jgi:hypothetical protein
MPRLVYKIFTEDDIGAKSAIYKIMGKREDNGSYAFCNQAGRGEYTAGYLKVSCRSPGPGMGGKDDDEKNTE